MSQTTLQYTAQLPKSAHRRLESALADMGRLYNALLIQRKLSTGTHRGRFSLKLQNRSIERGSLDPHPPGPKRGTGKGPSNSSSKQRRTGAAQTPLVAFRQRMRGPGNTLSGRMINP